MTKNRARLLILNYLCNFSLSLDYGEGRTSGGMKDYAFTPDSIFDRRDIRPGDLVALASAQFSKWYLSWVIDVKMGENRFVDVFGLESIEDGEVCNWSNVALNRMSRKAVSDHPEWRWTDEQFAFNDKWKQAHPEPYLYLPMQVQFDPDSNRADLGIRKRWSDETDFRPVRSVADWRKVSKKRLASLYDEMKAEIKNEQKNRRAAAAKP